MGERGACRGSGTEPRVGRGPRGENGEGAQVERIGAWISEWVGAELGAALRRGYKDYTALR